MSKNANRTEEIKGENKILNFFGGKVGRIVLTCVFAVIFLLVIALIADSGNGILLLLLAVPCTYFGLQVTAKIPNFLSRIPLGDWWFLILKIMLSIACGIFVGPFVLGKKISDKIAEYVKADRK